MPFFVFFEKKWLEKCPAKFKPVCYRRYVDDIFVLLKLSHFVLLIIS